MITDLNYLEAGMSEEFSDAINPENVIVREAINTVIGNLSESTTGEPELANLTYTVKEVNDTENFFNPSTLEKILADSDETVEELIDKISSNGLFGLSESVNYHSVNDTDYMHISAYESYLENTIDNELILNRFLTQDCGLLESSNIILEARIQDTIKNKWEVFKNFILRVSDRFKDAISNILDQNRKYLERYKKQILEVQPSDEIEVEYNGDYPEAQDRCLNTPLPVFNYERDAQWLRQDGFEGAVKDFMAGKSFKYVEGEDLAGQFKNWFLANERGTTKTKLSSLNFKQMYDFCYNSNKLINSINRDIKSIDQSTNQLLNAVNKEMRERGEKTQQNQAKNPQTQTTPAANNNANNNQSNGGSGTPSTSTSGGGNTSQTESGLLWMSLHEENGDNKPANNGSDLTINTPTNDVKDDNGNTTKETSKAPGKTNTTEQDMTYITGKWVQLCRSFLTAKLTITQQIARDYMNLIKTHLRSQNIDGYKEPGQDKDNKENNNQQNNNAENNNQQNNNNAENNKQNNNQ